MEYLEQALWEQPVEAGNLVTGFNQWNMVQVYRYFCPDDNVNEFRSCNQEIKSIEKIFYWLFWNLRGLITLTLVDTYSSGQK